MHTNSQHSRACKELQINYDDFIVSSYKYKELYRFQKYNAQTPVAALAKNIRQRWPLLKRIDTDTFVSPLPPHTLLASENSHKKNQKVFVWTFNDFNKSRHLIERGVDRIITDCPFKLSATLQNVNP